MKNKIRKIFIMLLIVTTMVALFTFKANALSLSYSGSSTSNGTGASASTSGFTISYDAASSNICGYRFSIVSSNGLPKSGTRVLNVYKTDLSIGDTAYFSGQRFISSANVAANKKQLANGTYVYSTTTTQGCDCYSTAAGFYSTIPQAPGSIGTWMKNSSNSYQNLQRIYYYCGSNLANATESDYVLVEPIFWVKLAGVRTAATATELAIYGASVSGGDAYNGGNGNLYNAGSGTLWNLMNYINREFPNALYVSSNATVYNAVSVISSGRYTYKQIIQNGYGCSVLTVKNVVPIKKVYIAYHPNGGTTNTALNEWGWVMLDGTVYFHSINHGVSDDPYNATTFGLTRAGYKFGGWKVNSTGTVLNQDTSYASTVYAHYDDASKTTANTSTVYCYLYAVWIPNTVYVAYHPNGGSTTYPLNVNGYVMIDDKAYFHTLTYGTSDDPYNASTLGLTKKGYTFKGWEILGSSAILDQDTQYASTQYTYYGDSSKTSANTEIVYCHLFAVWVPNTVYVAYHPNGGTTTYPLNVNGYVMMDGTPYLHSLKYGQSSDPYNASTLKLTKDGCTFKGWKILGSSVILDEDTEYASTQYTYYGDSSKTTANTEIVYCHLFAEWEQNEKVVIVPIEPNAAYRENTDVITSFWLVNISNNDCTPSTGEKVEFSVYNDSGEKIAGETESFVAPKNDKNLAYFKWHVPDGYAGANVTIKAHIIDGEQQYNHIEQSYRVASFDILTTPNTSYKDKAPSDFSVPNATFNNNINARWWQYSYSNGSFVKKEYAVGNEVSEVTLTTPTNPTAYTSNGKLYMKSGYGFECSYIHLMSTLSGYDSTSASQCVAPQYFYALFPEYNYTYGINICRSFEMVLGKNVFVNVDKMNRQHFTPIYYPDGEYNFQIVLSDCWTPAGMLTTYKTVTIQIYGNMYDDWYVGRK